MEIKDEILSDFYGGLRFKGRGIFNLNKIDWTKKKTEIKRFNKK